jgi:HAD superfamily hydrolase (TIGR01509 family)
MNPTPSFPPVRALLFDIGNVLLKFDFSIALRALAARSGIHDPVQALARIDQVKAPYEDGQFDRAAFLRAAFDVISYRGSEAEFVAAWEDIFEPNEPMLALLGQLHGRFPLFLLSNTNDLHLDYILRRYPAFRYFSGGTYSYAVRVSKPERAIFEIACRDLALEPATTFFIDDLLPNIETARALGFQTHHYHFERHGEFLSALASAGVMLV